MSGRRPPKKSDPLVVRMPHEDKEAFLDACRRDGRTASGVVRDLIGGYVRRAEMRERLRTVQPERRLAMILKSPKTRVAAAASAAAGALASVALLSAPSAAEFDYRGSFDQLDADRDGVITIEEYAGGGAQSTISIDLSPSAADDGARREENAQPENGAAAFTLEGSPSSRQESMTRFAFMIDIGFVEADRNGDGSVDFDEFVMRHEHLLADEFARMDADRSGRLSSEELLGGTTRQAPGLPSALFDAIDHDGDGAVTLEELQAGPARA